MKKFFNIVSSNNGVATIFLYGNIGNDSYYDVPSGQIAREVKEAEAAYQKIEVRINSYGGDVYAGIAIFNAFRNCKVDIQLFVDGIAASIASVIALCGRPVQMSKYARLMLHNVSGGAYGTKDDLKETIRQIESLESTVSDMYAAKTGKTVEDIKSAYFDGKDHWITADEALSLGFIDGIYDADPIPEDSTTEQIYQLFNNRLNKPNNNNEMSFFENFKKNPSFKDATSDDEVLRIVGQMETESAKASALAADVTRLTGELKVFQDKAKADEDAAKKKLLDDAEADGRIVKTQRVHFEAILNADLENGKAILAGIPKKKRVSDYLQTPPVNEASAWDKQMEDIRKKNNLN